MMFYTNPNDHACKLLFFAFKEIDSIHKLPWLVDGNFNEVSCKYDKSRGSLLNISLFRVLNGWVWECGILDLHAIGP